MSLAIEQKAADIIMRVLLKGNKYLSQNQNSRYLLRVPLKWRRYYVINNKLTSCSIIIIEMKAFSYTSKIIVYS